jgi:glycosyltransferase involved in cell wall biosynthesis
MRVLLLTFKGDRGENLAQSLAEHGHVVNVDGVLLGRHDLAAKMMRACRIVVQNLGRHDVVVAENPLWDALVALALTRLPRKRIPLVYYSKGFAPASLDEHGRWGLRRLNLWVLKRVLQSCDHVVFISDWLRRQYLQGMRIPYLALKPYSIIHNAPAPEFLDAEHDDSRKPAPESNPLTTTICYAGRFDLWDKSRGVILLLEALARLAREAPNLEFKCCVAGDGKYLPALTEAAANLDIADCVSFVGKLDRQALRDFYRSSDFFIYPSFQDACPTVVMEAQASGLPAVVTSSCGAAELVEHGLSGLICEPTPDSIAKAAAALIRDRSLCNKMGAQARMHIAHDLSWEVCARKMHEVLSKYDRRPWMPDDTTPPLSESVETAQEASAHRNIKT